MRICVLIAALAGTSTLPAIAHPGPHDAAHFAEQLSLAFKSAVETIKPSVVRIATTDRVRSRRGFRVFEGAGSGVLISEDGHIVTNAHVVEGADQIIAVLHDGRQLEASIEGLDQAADLAVITIEADELVPAVFADPKNLHVGQWVLAVGCPFNLAPSFSAGIISGTGRAGLGLNSLEHMIQTDAAINPGNSGGPLIDLQGRIIGINAAISTASGINSGVGFAIPVDMVTQVTAAVIAGQPVARGFFGVRLVSDVDEEEGQRCLIAWVGENAPAAKAGLEVGDVLLQVGPLRVRNRADAQHAIALLAPHAPATIVFEREGQRIESTIVPEVRTRDRVLGRQIP